MKITRISVWMVPLTSLETYYMADGKSCDTVETVIVRIDTETGLSGWGEVCPIPHYLPAYAKGVAPAIVEMAPALLGKECTGPSAIMYHLDKFLHGHAYAKSPLDMALWDLTAKFAKLPLYQLLGGRLSQNMPLYHSITCVDPDEMGRIAKEVYQDGIRQFQVKLGADQDNEADIARLSKVRETVGAGPLVYGDWNCGASKLDAMRVGRAVRHLDVMLEQPCDSLSACADVQNATGLPMKMDEGAHDIASMMEAHSLGCMDAVAIKLSKFGGIDKARRARDLSEHFGTMMCIEDTWGSDITTAAVLHLGATTAPKYLLNVCDLSGYVNPRLAPNGPVRENGTITPPEGVGLGVEPDRDVLGEPALILD